MTNKRILILNWWDPKNPQAGGAEVHLNEIFSRLVKKGYKITLLCSKYARAKNEENINGIRVIRKGPFWLINITSIFYYLRHHHQFDMVIDYTNKIPYLTPLYVRRKKCLAVAHHVFGKIWEKELGFWGKIFEFLEKMVYKLYRKRNFVAVSKSTKDELIEIGVRPEKIKIIYSGLSCPVKSGPKSENPLIIYLGRLKKYKRIDWILEAAPKIIDSFPEARFVIIGTGDDEQRLKTLAQKLRLNSFFTFTGFIPENPKLTYLKKAWLHIQPSIKEGWGFTVIEAAACGTPTIATDAPGLREVVLNNKTGWLFREKSQRALEKLIIEALTNNQKRNALGNQAKVHARKFSWDKAAFEFEEQINNILFD